MAEARSVSTRCLGSKASRIYGAAERGHITRWKSMGNDFEKTSYRDGLMIALDSYRAHILLTSFSGCLHFGSFDLQFLFSFTSMSLRTVE